MTACVSVSQPPQWPEAQVRQAIVRESLADYPGACPCPESIMRNGRRCGRNSAYSKPGGREPICYEDEVTAEQIAAWRRQRSRTPSY